MNEDIEREKFLADLAEVCRGLQEWADFKLDCGATVEGLKAQLRDAIRICDRD